MTAHLEAGACRAAGWECVILTCYAAWGEAPGTGGGTVELNPDQQNLTGLEH